MVVLHGDVNVLPRRARGERPGLKADVVLGVVEGPRVGAVTLVAVKVGQMLMKRSPACDVQQLHAAADPEQRQIEVDRGVRERDLNPVANGVGSDRGRMRLRAVTGGIDVCTAGEHQAVQQFQRLPRVLAVLRVGRDDQSEPAGTLHRGHVGERRQHGGLIPDGPACVLDGTAYPDDRALHTRNLTLVGLPS